MDKLKINYSKIFTHRLHVNTIYNLYLQSQAVYCILQTKII